MLVKAVLATAIPALIAVGLVGIGRAFGDRIGRCWGTSAVGLAYLAGHAGVAGLIFPAGEVTDRIPWIAILAMFLAVTEAVRDLGTVARFVGRSILFEFALGVVLGPLVSTGPVERELAVKLALATALAIVAWINLELLGARGDVRNALLITAGGASVVLLSSGSVVLGLLGASLTAALAGGELAGAVRKGDRAFVGGVAGAAAILVALVLEGHIYASLPGSSALLLAAGPAAAWVPRGSGRSNASGPGPAVGGHDSAGSDRGGNGSRYVVRFRVLIGDRPKRRSTTSSRLPEEASDATATPLVPADHPRPRRIGSGSPRGCRGTAEAIARGARAGRGGACFEG